MPSERPKGDDSRPNTRVHIFEVAELVAFAEMDPFSDGLPHTDQSISIVLHASRDCLPCGETDNGLIDVGEDEDKPEIVLLHRM